MGHKNPRDAGNLFGEDLPALVRSTVKGGTIQERFERFHGLNPWVYDSLVSLARDYVEQGNVKVGIKMCYEVLRWQRGRRTAGSEIFRLSNDFHSRYARLIMDEEPDLEGRFDTRELRESAARAEGLV